MLKNIIPTTLTDVFNYMQVMFDKQGNHLITMVSEI